MKDKPKIVTLVIVWVVIVIITLWLFSFKLTKYIWGYISFAGVLVAVWYGVRTKMKPRNMSQDRWDWISAIIALAVIWGIIYFPRNYPI
jgi:hypothetical protein